MSVPRHLKINMHIHGQIDGLDPYVGPLDEEQAEWISGVCRLIEDAIEDIDVDDLTVLAVCVEDVCGTGGGDSDLDREIDALEAEFAPQDLESKVIDLLRRRSNGSDD